MDVRRIASNRDALESGVGNRGQPRRSQGRFLAPLGSRCSVRQSTFKRMLTVAAAIVLAGCGGGGGSGGEGGSDAQFTNTGTTVRALTSGDTIRYAATVDQAGDKSEYVEDLRFGPGPAYTDGGDTLQIVRETSVVTFNGDVADATFTDYWSGPQGARYLLRQGTATLQELKDGAMPTYVPSPLTVGASWHYDDLFDVSDAAPERRTFTASVVGMEDVETPLGTFRSFKIVYGLTCESTGELPYCRDVYESENGVLYIYPQIGIVRRQMRYSSLDVRSDDLKIDETIAATNIGFN